LLPGDPLFSSFLGPADLDFRPVGSGHQHFFIIGACGVNCPNVAPVLMSHTFSASFDVTYRYCTPGVDLGCPAAIVGFNSPIPEPATLFLFAAGLAVVMAGAHRRQFERSP
jgi:hypothetical protein